MSVHHESSTISNWTGFPSVARGVQRGQTRPLDVLRTAMLLRDLTQAPRRRGVNGFENGNRPRRRSAGHGQAVPRPRAGPVLPNVSPLRAIHCSPDTTSVVCPFGSVAWELGRVCNFRTPKSTKKSERRKIGCNDSCTWRRLRTMLKGPEMYTKNDRFPFKGRAGGDLERAQLVYRVRRNLLETSCKSR